MDYDIIKVIKTIHQIKDNGQFLNYINYIKFPGFKNLELGTKIDFDFPLTVFVGPNGSGKSSTLHALYGSVHRKTPYDFWFSTAVDPIEDRVDGKIPHCFYYEYKSPDGKRSEVLKTRVFLKKDKNYDYWETSRPIIDYGMKKLQIGEKRKSPVKKDVVYLDFRAELSAFDKYFHFITPDKYLKSNRKQDYLRRKSKFLKKCIEDKIIIKGVNNTSQNKKIEPLSKDELNAISLILGREYSSASIVEHKFFKEFGFSVIFQTKHFKYSEAFAGSGETAIIRLVTKVLKAKPNALVLLDEPEVSLHPGAQRNLKIFLLEQIKTKKLQVIISTHSPALIEDLPQEAIKVFTQLQTSGKFSVKNKSTPEQAFYYIGQPNPDKKIIIVEDKLSKYILEEVIKKQEPDLASLFEVKYHPGGASHINKELISVYSQDGSGNKFIVYDGDQNFGTSAFDLTLILEKDKTKSFLQKKIKEQTKSDIKFYPDGSPEGGNEAQEISLMEKYLLFYKDYVRYLPKNTPEEIIWDNEYCRKLLETSDKNDVFSGIEKITNYKDKFATLAKHLSGDKSDTFTLYKIFFQKWITKKNNDYNEIREIINEIKNKHV